MVDAPGRNNRCGLLGATALTETVQSRSQRRENSTVTGISSGCRPFHKPGAGCASYPRCWRSRRTAISSSYRIEQTPTSGCICSSTPTTDARAIPAALPSPAGAVVLARANAALSELVHSTSPAPAGWRTRVAGGAEEPLLGRRIGSSKRRRQDGYAAPRRRRTRARSRRLSLRLRERLCSPARTPRCRSPSRPAAPSSLAGVVAHPGAAEAASAGRAVDCRLLDCTKKQRPRGRGARGCITPQAATLARLPLWAATGSPPPKPGPASKCLQRPRVRLTGAPRRARSGHRRRSRAGGPDAGDRRDLGSHSGAGQDPLRSRPDT